MTHTEKKQYRAEMKELKKQMKVKPKKFMAFLPMRDGKAYYRGFQVEKKQDVVDYIPIININDVWYWKLEDGVIW